MSFSDTVMKLTTTVDYVTGVPLFVAIVIILAWLINTCIYLKFAHKKLRRLRQNRIDNFTIKITKNAQFNFHKFITIVIVLTIELCILVLPGINHGIFDRRLTSENKPVCIEGCCLKNWTFAYRMERLGKWGTLTCLIDSSVFTAYYCEYWIFAFLMQYSQLAFIEMERERERRKLVRRLKWKIVLSIALSMIVFALLAIRHTIPIGSILYSILTCACLPLITMHYRKLKRMRRRHLADLSYECYMDTNRIKNEIHSVKWIERGSETVIIVMCVSILLNTFEMIVTRVISTLLINPCWFKLTYSISINITLSNTAINTLILAVHVAHLLRSVIILFLFLTVIIIHIAVVIDKLMLKVKRRGSQDMIKKLIEENNAEWHGSAINVDN